MVHVTLVKNNAFLLQMWNADCTNRWIKWEMDHLSNRQNLNWYKIIISQTRIWSGKRNTEVLQEHVKWGLCFLWTKWRNTSAHSILCYCIQYKEKHPHHLEVYSISPPVLILSVIVRFQGWITWFKSWVPQGRISKESYLVSWITYTSFGCLYLHIQ